jgi:drug/metabolite transporter (DMT)-like permease
LWFFSPRLIGEYVTRRKLLGILLGLIGALFIAFLPFIERGQNVSGDFRGNLMILIAVMCWSGYTIKSRLYLITNRATPITMTALSFFVSTAVFALLALFYWQSSYISAFTAGNIAIIVHLGIFLTVATYLIHQWAIKHSSATTAALNQYLQPAFSIIFNYFFLGEHLNVGFAIGSILVFFGIFFATGDRLITEIKSWQTKQS